MRQPPPRIPRSARSPSFPPAGGRVLRPCPFPCSPPAKSPGAAVRRCDHSPATLAADSTPFRRDALPVGQQRYACKSARRWPPRTGHPTRPRGPTRSGPLCRAADPDRARCLRFATGEPCTAGPQTGRWNADIRAVAEIRLPPRTPGSPSSTRLSFPVADGSRFTSGRGPSRRTPRMGPPSSAVHRTARVHLVDQRDRVLRRWSCGPFPGSREIAVHLEDARAYATAWAILPSAILPRGMSTATVQRPAAPHTRRPTPTCLPWTRRSRPSPLERVVKSSTVSPGLKRPIGLAPSTSGPRQNKPFHLTQFGDPDQRRAALVTVTTVPIGHGSDPIIPRSLPAARANGRSQARSRCSPLNRLTLTTSPHTGRPAICPPWSAGRVLDAACLTMTSWRRRCGPSWLNRAIAHVLLPRTRPRPARARPRGRHVQADVVRSASRAHRRIAAPVRRLARTLLPPRSGLRPPATSHPVTSLAVGAPPATWP